MLALLGSAAWAQSTPMRFIVGLAPGGAVDPYARIIAEHMAKTLGRTIIVENRPGATGNISAQFIIDAPADGTLVWVGTQALTEINPSVFSNLRWSIDDFLPLIKGVQAPLVLVAHPSVPASSFAEFVTWAKANRGKLTYSSYTAGTPSHFLGFQLNEKFDLDLTHVPYRGSGLQVNGLVAGHSLFGFAQVNSSAPQYAAGQAQGVRHHQRRALAGDEGRSDLRRAGPSGVHDPGVVRPAGQAAARRPTSSLASPTRPKRRTPTPACAASSKPRVMRSPAKPGRSSCLISRHKWRVGAGSCMRRDFPLTTAGARGSAYALRVGSGTRSTCSISASSSRSVIRRARAGVRRIVPQVIELAGIACEIVKLAPSGAVEHAQAIAAVDQGVDARRHVRARARMLMVVLDEHAVALALRAA